MGWSIGFFNLRWSPKEEGIYEFIRKVMHSWIDALGMRWPRARGMRHAWCCMLANPQNLNIVPWHQDKPRGAQD